MKFKFLRLLVTTIAALPALAIAEADPKIKVEVSTLTNVANSTALEACGTATHADGIRPLLVTITHAGAEYSTMTSPSGAWCIVVKRRSYDGKLEASAVTLKSLE